MTHYAMAQWVDFSRGLSSDGDRSMMEAHLAGGCVDCREALSFCERLASVCRRASAYAVPDYVLRRARAIFPAPPVAERPKRAFRIPIELIYDSFLVPAPAGLRSTWQVGWQGLFQAGECSVDLRIEPELHSSKASVIGQISNHVVPGTEMVDIPVCLRAGKQVVAETRSNRFGEFQMEYEQQGRLWLCIYLNGGKKCIQLPLKRLASDKPSSERLNLGTAGGANEPGKGAR